MNQICRDIFRAIHEGKWLKIEYRNKADQITKYWIGIRDLDPVRPAMCRHAAVMAPGGRGIGHPVAFGKKLYQPGQLVDGHVLAAFHPELGPQQSAEGLLVHVRELFAGDLDLAVQAQAHCVLIHGHDVSPWLW